jgi:hypothetical protein
MRKFVLGILLMIPSLGVVAEEKIVDGKRVEETCLFSRRREQLALAQQANHTLMHMYAEQRVQTEILRQLAGAAQYQQRQPQQQGPWTFPANPSQVPPDWQYRQQFPMNPSQVPPDQQYRQQMPLQPQQVQPAPDYRQQLPTNPGQIAPDPNFRLTMFRR